MTLRILQKIGAAVLLTATAWAQLPERPGKLEVERLCVGCHELERSISKRQDRDGWQATLSKMTGMGMKATDEELRVVADYLVDNFPAEALPRININKAPAIELESVLSLRRSQAAALVAYREKKGPLKSMEDLKKIPGIDFSKIEAKKDRIAF